MAKPTAFRAEDLTVGQAAIVECQDAILVAAMRDGLVAGADFEIRACRDPPERR
jgi:hypothetical protein